jgi:hypothetical protein
MRQIARSWQPGIVHVVKTAPRVILNSRAVVRCRAKIATRTTATERRRWNRSGGVSTGTRAGAAGRRICPVVPEGRVLADVGRGRRSLVSSNVLHSEVSCGGGGRVCL